MPEYAPKPTNARRNRNVADPDGPGLAPVPLRSTPGAAPVPRTNPVPAHTPKAAPGYPNPNKVPRQTGGYAQAQAPMQRQSPYAPRTGPVSRANPAPVYQPAPRPQMSEQQRSMVEGAMQAAMAPRSAQAPAMQQSQYAPVGGAANAAMQAAMGRPSVGDALKSAWAGNAGLMSFAPGGAGSPPASSPGAGTGYYDPSAGTGTQASIEQYMASLVPAATAAMGGTPAQAMANQVWNGAGTQENWVRDLLGGDIPFTVDPTTGAIVPDMAALPSKSPAPATPGDVQDAVVQAMLDALKGNDSPGIFSEAELAAQKYELDKQAAAAKDAQMQQLGAAGIDASALGASMLGDIDAKTMGLKTDLETNNRVAGIEKQLNELAQISSIYGSQMSLEQQKDLAQQQLDLQKQLAEAQLSSDQKSDAMSMAEYVLAMTDSNAWKTKDLGKFLEQIGMDPTVAEAIANTWYYDYEVGYNGYAEPGQAGSGSTAPATPTSSAGAQGMYDAAAADGFASAPPAYGAVFKPNGSPWSDLSDAERASAWDEWKQWVAQLQAVSAGASAAGSEWG